MDVRESNKRPHSPEIKEEVNESAQLEMINNSATSQSTVHNENQVSDASSYLLKASLLQSHAELKDFVETSPWPESNMSHAVESNPSLQSVYMNIVQIKLAYDQYRIDCLNEKYDQLSQAFTDLSALVCAQMGVSAAPPAAVQTGTNDIISVVYLDSSVLNKAYNDLWMDPEDTANFKRVNFSDVYQAVIAKRRTTVDTAAFIKEFQTELRALCSEFVSEILLNPADIRRLNVVKMTNSRQHGFQTRIAKKAKLSKDDDGSDYLFVDEKLHAAFLLNTLSCITCEDKSFVLNPFSFTSAVEDALYTVLKRRRHQVPKKSVSALLMCSSDETPAHHVSPDSL